MQKYYSSIAWLISFMFISACAKDKTETNTTSNTDTYKVFNVHVQKSYDKTALLDYPLCFLQTTWTSGSTYKDSVMFYTKTDTKGNALFKINDSLIQEKGNIFYYIATYVDYANTAPDSTKAEWKFNGSSQVYHFGDANYHPTMEVSPNCNAKIISNGSDWEEKKIDSLFIFTKLDKQIPHVFHYGLGVVTYDFQLIAECSETNMVTYYYYSNGIKSKEFTKEFYVPFSALQSPQPAILDFK